MAVVLGLSAYELAVLAVGAAALVLASPPGQEASKQAARAIGEAIDNVGKKADEEPTDAPPMTIVGCPDSAGTKEQEKQKEKECDPCPTPPPPQVHRDHTHFPCQDHWHYFVYNQNSETCECFLQRKFGGCLGPDEQPPLS
jgi:hypothetical protein